MAKLIHALVTITNFEMNALDSRKQISALRGFPHCFYGFLGLTLIDSCTFSFEVLVEVCTQGRYEPFMRSSFRIIGKIFNFAVLSHSPVSRFGLSLLERSARMAEKEMATAAIFGGNQ